MLGHENVAEGGTDGKGKVHWFAQHIEPIAGVLRELPPACTQVAHEIARRANSSGVAVVTRAVGAAGAGLAERSWQRALRDLERAGVIRTRHHDGGWSEHLLGAAKAVHLPHRCAESVDNGATASSPVGPSSRETSSPVSSPGETKPKSLLDMWMQSRAGDGTPSAPVRSTSETYQNVGEATVRGFAARSQESESWEGAADDVEQTEAFLRARCRVYPRLAKKLAQTTTLRFVQYAWRHYAAQARDGLLSQPPGVLVMRAVQRGWSLEGGPPPGPGSRTA